MKYLQQVPDVRWHPFMQCFISKNYDLNSVKGQNIWERVNGLKLKIQNLGPSLYMNFNSWVYIQGNAKIDYLSSKLRRICIYCNTKCRQYDTIKENILIISVLLSFIFNLFLTIQILISSVQYSNNSTYLLCQRGPYG